MNTEDEDPTGTSRRSWTRWDSAQVAAENIAELALNLDADSKVDIMLWDGDKYSRLQHKYEQMTEINQISRFFKENRPQRGSTPLSGALEEVYNTHLRSLLNKSEPFTVVILTDGAPNEPAKVKNFFNHLFYKFNFIL